MALHRDCPSGLLSTRRGTLRRADAVFKRALTQPPAVVRCASLLYLRSVDFYILPRIPLLITWEKFETKLLSLIILGVL